MICKKCEQYFLPDHHKQKYCKNCQAGIADGTIPAPKFLRYYLNNKEHLHQISRSTYAKRRGTKVCVRCKKPFQGRANSYCDSCLHSPKKQRDKKSDTYQSDYYQRVTKKKRMLHSGKFICDYCKEIIPEQVIARRHYTHRALPDRIFCGKEHQVLARKESKEYKEMSVKGRSARSKAVTLSNHVNPRRKRAK